MLKELSKLSIVKNTDLESYLSLSQYIISTTNPSSKDINIFFNENIFKLNNVLIKEDLLKLLKYQESVSPGYLTLVNTNNIVSQLADGEKVIKKADCNRIVDFIIEHYSDSASIMRGLVTGSNLNVMVALGDTKRICLLNDKYKNVDLNILIKKITYAEDIQILLDHYPSVIAETHDTKDKSLWQRIIKRFETNDKLKIRNYNGTPTDFYLFQTQIYINMMLQEWAKKYNFKEIEKELKQSFAGLFTVNTLRYFKEKDIRELTDLLSGNEHYWTFKDKENHIALFNLLNHVSDKSRLCENTSANYENNKPAFLKFIKNIIKNTDLSSEIDTDGETLYHKLIIHTFNTEFFSEIEKDTSFSQLFDGRGLLHRGFFYGNTHNFNTLFSLYNTEYLLGTYEHQKVLSDNMINNPQSAYVMKSIFENMNPCAVSEHLITTLIINAFYCDVVNSQDKTGEALDSLKEKIKELDLNFIPLPNTESLLQSNRGSLFYKLGARLKGSNTLSEKYENFMIFAERQVLNKNISINSKKMHNRL